MDTEIKIRKPFSKKLQKSGNHFKMVLTDLRWNTSSFFMSRPKMKFENGVDQIDETC